MFGNGKTGYVGRNKWVWEMDEENSGRISLSEVLFTPFMVPVKSEYIFNR